MTQKQALELKAKLESPALYEISFFKIAYAINKNLPKLKQVEEAFIKSREILAKANGAKSENGNLLVENNSYVFDSAEEKEAYNLAFLELQNIEVDFQPYKVKLSDIEKFYDSDYAVINGKEVPKIMSIQLQLLEGIIEE